MRCNDHNTYLLGFLFFARVIAPDQIVALLNPRRKNVGNRRHGAAKSWRSSVAYKEVAFLVKERYLRKWAGAYMLGSASIRHFEGVVKTKSRLRYRVLKSYPEAGTVKHDLLITHLLVVLCMAMESNPNRWRIRIHLDGDEPKMRIANTKYIKLDKLITIDDLLKNRSHHFFVEADRSTSALVTNLPSKRNIRSRALGYFRFHKAGGIPRHFGLPGARLLFICPEGRNKRLQNIYATVQRIEEIPENSTIFRYITAEPQHFKHPEQFVKWLCYKDP